MKQRTKTKKQNSHERDIFGIRLSKSGLLGGGLFFALSLFPSLLPRTYLFQGIASGIVVAIGYGLGVLIWWLWRYFELASLETRYHVHIKTGIGGLIVAAMVGASWQYVGWQNGVRREFVMPQVKPSMLLPMIVVTIVVSLVLLLISRALWWAYNRLSKIADIYLPQRLSRLIGAVALFALLAVLINGVLVRGFIIGASHMFSVADHRYENNIVEPVSALRSGSSSSYVTWNSLGRQGRKFVSTGPDQQALNSFSGGGAKEPIRVYAGLESAATQDARAELVLKELIRTHAFDRKVLLVATTTGTGWLDEKAMDPLEYVNNGDTAIVGVQYSYFPSWISLMTDQTVVQQNSQLVFSKIYDYWATLPAQNRPKFYVYGLSLGSFGAENFLRSIELVNEPINGALLAGPPFVNKLHHELLVTRDKGSPEWQPIINNGRTVRFTGRDNALNKPTGTWGNTKIIYMQHASDPVVWFSTDLLFKKPDWLKHGQRGPDIAPQFVWVPIVTMFQVGLDFPDAADAPVGHGHNYAATANVDAWAALTQPQGWTTAKAAQLKAKLAHLQ